VMTRSSAIEWGVVWVVVISCILVGRSTAKAMPNEVTRMPERSGKSRTVSEWLRADFVSLFGDSFNGLGVFGRTSRACC
jgi:hypothetical protein